MARLKAKARSATPPLKGCVITFGGTSVPAGVLGGKSLQQVKADIVSQGGLYESKIQECTHLVVTEAQFKKSLSKVAAAEQSGQWIVTFDWLQKALSGASPVDESAHSLNHQNPTTVKPTNGSGGLVNTNDPTTATNDASDSKQRNLRKRKRSDVKDEDEDEDEDETDVLPARSVGNGKDMNVTKKLDMKIPLDEVLVRTQGSDFVVHIGDDSTIYDVTLNQSDSGKNANKFYRLQLLKGPLGSWWVWTRWGRVGEDGQSKLLCGGAYDEALSEFQKKFKDKTGNTWDERSTGPLRPKKYVFIERSYEDSDSDDQKDLPGADKRPKIKNEEEQDEEKHASKLPEPVQRLLKLIFNQDYFNATFDDFDYDSKKMPLGKLSKSSLMRGYEVLKTLSSLVGASGSTSQIQTLSNQYLSLIPHVVPRSSRPPVLDTMDKVKKEVELLEVLTDMQLANDVMKVAKKNDKTTEEINLLDRQFQGLGMQEMEPLESSSTEYHELENYLVKSVGHTHGTQYKVQDIFRIERHGEHDRFDLSEYAKAKDKNRRLLWHGSRATNFGGILSQGLRIAPPEAPVSGYMFGKGVYLADMSSKSANYCCSYSSGDTGLLLLCEAELGEPPLKLTSGDYNAGDRAKEAGCLSTWGVGRTAPIAWKDAGSAHSSLKGVSMPDVVSKAPGPTNEQGAYLQYNEYIVYDVAQIKLRYLFRVSM